MQNQKTEEELARPAAMGVDWGGGGPDGVATFVFPVPAMDMGKPVIPIAGASADPGTGAEPASASETGSPDLTKIYTVPNVFKTKLAHISHVEARDGFVMVYTNDGKVHRKTAEEVRDVARDCATMLEHMYKSEGKGVPATPHIKAQTQELISKLSAAFRQAKQQQESALKMDHAPRAVKRMSDNLAWQQGKMPERGPYTADAMPEELNLRYLCQRFPKMSEGEIATIMRSTQVPYNVRLQILSGMNGKRLMEENRLTAKDVMKMVGGGGKIEMPAGVGLHKAKDTEPKISVPATKLESK